VAGWAKFSRVVCGARRSRNAAVTIFPSLAGSWWARKLETAVPLFVKSCRIIPGPEPIACGCQADSTTLLTLRRPFWGRPRICMSIGPWARQADVAAARSGDLSMMSTVSQPSTDEHALFGDPTAVLGAWSVPVIYFLLFHYPGSVPFSWGRAVTDRLRRDSIFFFFF